MKISFIVFSLLCSILFSDAQIVEKVNMPFNNNSYDILIMKIDSSMKNFKIIKNSEMKTEKLFFDSLSKFGSFFAINAGIVDTSCRLLGLLIDNGREIQSINNSSGAGNFYLKPNGFLALSSENAVVLKADNYNPNNSYSCAIQSGPMLLTDNNVNIQFDRNSKNKNYRIGVGVYEQKGEKFIVFASSNVPVTFYQFTLLFLTKYKCSNALNLESGSYCSLKTPSAKKPFSKTRIVCNYLYFQLK